MNPDGLFVSAGGCSRHKHLHAICPVMDQRAQQDSLTCFWQPTREAKQAFAGMLQPLNSWLAVAAPGRLLKGGRLPERNLR